MVRKPRPTALVKAVELLARQEQSTQTLRRKLLERGYDEAEVNAAIDRLTEKKYLNDAETCASQFENLYAAENLSVRQIYAKLIQRGFDAETVRNFIPADTYAHELAAAKKTAAKKFAGKTDANIKNKIWQYLASRGFDSEIIRVTADDLLNGDGD